MAHVTGLFNTGSIVPDLAKKSFAGYITELMPNGSAPLFAISSQLTSEVAVQVEHGFFTETMLFPQMTLGTGGQAAGDTIFDVVSTENILPGMILQVASTSENILVNAIISPTQVSVQRGLGSTAQAIAASIALYQVGNAYEEASLRPNSLLLNPVRITNLTQIFRNTWAISDTVRATMLIAGDTNVAKSKKQCAAFHAVDIEKSLLFGQKSQGTRNGQPFRTMDGLINIIGNLSYYPASYSAANVSTAGATTNYTQLEGFLDPVFNQTTDPKGGNTRVLFCGGTAKKVLNNIGRLNGTYQLEDGQTSFGLQFSRFKIARGEFNIVEHPLFNTNATWSKLALAVDLPTFSVAYLGDRKTQHADFNANTDNDNGQDSVGGTLTTELTTVVKNPPASAIIWNLTAGAAG